MTVTRLHLFLCKTNQMLMSLNGTQAENVRTWQAKCPKSGAHHHHVENTECIDKECVFFPFDIFHTKIHKIKARVYNPRGLASELARFESGTFSKFHPPSRQCSIQSHAPTNLKAHLAVGLSREKEMQTYGHGEQTLRSQVVLAFFCDPEVAVCLLWGEK